MTFHFPSHTIHFTRDNAFKFQGDSDSKLIHTHTKDKTNQQQTHTHMQTIILLW